MLLITSANMSAHIGKERITDENGKFLHLLENLLMAWESMMKDRSSSVMYGCKVGSSNTTILCKLLKSHIFKNTKFN